MALDVQAFASIAALIANGGSKSDSRYRNDSEFDEAWDLLSADIAEMRRRNPDVSIELPNEWPEPEEPEGQAPQAQ